MVLRDSWDETRYRWALRFVTLVANQLQHGESRVRGVSLSIAFRRVQGVRWRLAFRHGGTPCPGGNPGTARWHQANMFTRTQMLCAVYLCAWQTLGLPERFESTSGSSARAPDPGFRRRAAVRERSRGKHAATGSRAAGQNHDGGGAMRFRVRVLSPAACSIVLAGRQATSC